MPGQQLGTIADTIRSRATQIAVKGYLARGPIGVNPESCTWANVLDEMNRAKEEWEDKGKFRVRNGDIIERVLLPLLDAIPTDNGLSLLKGALTVIFHVSSLHPIRQPYGRFGHRRGSVIRLTFGRLSRDGQKHAAGYSPASPRSRA